jgi:chemotaxis signal transduction protein
MILPKFEGPHDSIHAIAKKVKELQNSDKFDEAMALIEKTRNSELARMVELFAEAKATIRERKRELAIVIELNDKKIAMAVDTVESVEHLNQKINRKMRIAHAGAEDAIVERVSQRTKDDAMVVVLNVENLIKIDECQIH